MNQPIRNCNGCQQPGHILRFCREHRCTGCEELGHAVHCPRQFQLRKLCLWLPYTMGARIGISQSPLREVPGVGRNLQLIRSAGTTTMIGSTFEAYFNSLRINYGGEGSIVIALQDAPTEAETLVQIRNVRQDNINQRASESVRNTPLWEENWPKTSIAWQRAHDNNSLRKVTRRNHDRCPTSEGERKANANHSDTNRRNGSFPTTNGYISAAEPLRLQQQNTSRITARITIWDIP